MGESGATKIGLVGCGGWGKLILRDLKEIGCEVAVVARSDESISRAIEFAADSIVSSIEELPDPSGIFVATPLTTHYEVLCQTLDTFPEVPIFCEKALTMRVEDALDLRRRADGKIFVMDKWRYQEGVLALKEIGQRKELGEVIGLETVRRGWGNHHGDVDMIWTLLPHDLSIALEILGEVPEVQRAVADSNQHGAFGLKGILGSRPWLTVDVSSRSAERSRVIRLTCEDGLAWIDPVNAHDSLFVSRTADPFVNTELVVETRELKNTMPLYAEIEAFVRFVQGSGGPPKSSLAEAIAIVRSTVALRESAGLVEEK